MQKSTRLIKIIVFGATGRTGKLDTCKRILNSGLLLQGFFLAVSQKWLAIDSFSFLKYAQLRGYLSKIKSCAK